MLDEAAADEWVSVRIWVRGDGLPEWRRHQDRHGPLMPRTLLI